MGIGNRLWNSRLGLVRLRSHETLGKLRAGIPSGLSAIWKLLFAGSSTPRQIAALEVVSGQAVIQELTSIEGSMGPDRGVIRHDQTLPKHPFASQTAIEEMTP